MGDEAVDRFAEDKEIILAVYADAIANHGATPRGITWGSEASQRLRFSVLADIGNLDQRTILDVGCGFGDLYRYLVSEHGVQRLRYIGVDINPVLIEIARSHYKDVEFEVCDLLRDPLGWKPDYVVASGAFGIATPHWEEHTHAMLCKMFELSRIGIAVNFLTTYSPTRTGSHYVDPFEMLRFVCASLSPKVVLRQEYKDNDFTIYAYKNPALPTHAR